MKLIRFTLVEVCIIWGIVLLLLSCLGIPGMDLVADLLVGWAPFLGRVGRQVRPRWDVIGSTLVYVVLFILGSHLFLRWLYREIGSGKWRMRWTLSGFFLVILMFASGLGMIGVVHQTGWLITSPEPLFYRGSGSRELVNRARCINNLRAIGSALKVYREKHGGKNPDDLAALLSNEDVNAEMFVCPSSSDFPATGPTPAAIAEDLKKPGHVSYIYLGKGLSEPIDPHAVLALEPLENHVGDGINVLHGDGNAEWLERPEAEELLKKLNIQRPSPSTRPGA